MTEIYYTLNRQQARRAITCFEQLSRSSSHPGVAKFTKSVAKKITTCIQEATGNEVRIHTDIQNHDLLQQVLFESGKHSVRKCFLNYRRIEQETRIPKAVMNNARKAWKEMDRQEELAKKRKQSPTETKPPKGCLF